YAETISDCMGIIVVVPPRRGNVLAIDRPAREIYHLPTSPEFLRPSTAAMTRKRQQPRQNILAEPMHALPRRGIDRIANDLESMSCGDTMKRVEICNRADDVYVREFRLAH